MQLENLSKKIAQLEIGGDYKISIVIKDEYKYQFQIIRMVGNEWIIFGGYGLGLYTFPKKALTPDEITVEFVNALKGVDLTLKDAKFVSQFDLL